MREVVRKLGRGTTSVMISPFSLPHDHTSFAVTKRTNMYSNRKKNVCSNKKRDIYSKRKRRRKKKAKEEEEVANIWTGNPYMKQMKQK